YVICAFYVQYRFLFVCRFSPVFFFFFSSRRRHTRSKRDWSSDVCSSDLPAHLTVTALPTTPGPPATSRRGPHLLQQPKVKEFPRDTPPDSTARGATCRVRCHAHYRHPFTRDSGGSLGRNGAF